MAETNATILIPDISGFTEFITSTELLHGAHTINLLIDAMVREVGDEYEVTEIEGDAVLMIRKGAAPTQEELENICLRIFNAFHFQRIFMQQHTICPCGACQGIINLTVKFIAHHGPLAEITVGRFVKQSGPAMIVAHRLLKNSIDNHEYLLVTDTLLQNVSDTFDPIEMTWVHSSEEYSSIGTVDYHFALLNQARKKVPQPPEPLHYVYSETDNNEELYIQANYRDVYMGIWNLQEGVKWIPGLLRVEPATSELLIGTIQHAIFEKCSVTLSPLNMTMSDEGIMYAESCEIPEMDLHLNLEFVCKNAGDKICHLAWRFINTSNKALSQEQKLFFFNRMKSIMNELKSWCEKIKESIPEPLVK